MSLRTRILAVDDDGVFLDLVRDQLGKAGFQVAVEREPSRVVPRASAWHPALILMDRTMPLLSGVEVTRALRSFEATSAIPVAFLTSETSDLEAMRALRSGAVDVLHKPFGAEHVQRVRTLLEELGSNPAPGSSPQARLLQALLGYFRRSKRSATMLLNPGTPFEGKVIFEAGALASAEFGPAAGVAALEEMLWVEDGVWRFESDGVPVPAQADQSAVELSADDFEEIPLAKPRLLFVDDEPDLCRLYKIHFTRAGFDTDTAEDGHEGFRLASATPYDVIVADLNMPRMDGWGLLRLLKADHFTRETPVFFLSAHDDYRETLRAAHAGAADYLAKTGRAEHVVARARGLVEPRQAALTLLQGGNRKAALDLSLVGAQWLLRTLAAQRATGRLEARDEWGRYEVLFREGQISEASATTATKTVPGVSALAALFVSRGAQGSFDPGPVALDKQLGQPIEEAIRHGCEMLNQLEARANAQRLAQAGPVNVDRDLYQLFLRIASDRDLLLARAVCETGVKLADLSETLKMSAEDVQAGLIELLRRRIIGFGSER